VVFGVKCTIENIGVGNGLAGIVENVGDISKYQLQIFYVRSFKRL
jgi:hypothetical protein